MAAKDSSVALEGSEFKYYGHREDFDRGGYFCSAPDLNASYRLIGYPNMSDTDPLIGNRQSPLRNPQTLLLTFTGVGNTVRSFFTG